ncbi:MAG TPA: glycosyltransferase 87 family protein [Actinophytocola sp.]|uniref:glycosyltransferase 87 family protein n=1 Tax=Actinophytocola sp. TaxID=1872138 RepID=UPI002DFA7B90|nr:glycosyltransferase 87 family protein [Actinophytocola sp.]
MTTEAPDRPPVPTGGLGPHVPLAISAVVCAAGAWWALRPSWQVPAPTTANRPEVRLQDFRDALYFPIRELLAGGNPYDPAAMFAHWPVRQDFNLYQPYHLVLHLPFALPGYRAGAVAFTVLALLLLVVLAGMAARRLAMRVPVPLAPATAALATVLVLSQVGKAQLYLGQVNPLVAVGAAGALLARHSRPRWASVALAIAWLKPQFGLPLAILLFARGSRRVALGGTAVAAVASLPVVVVLVVRGGGVGPFLDVIRANLAHAASTDYGAVDSFTAQRVDLPAVLFRLAGWLAPAAEPATLAGVLAIGVVLVRRLDRLADPDSAAVADLLTCLTVVVALVHQPGDVLIAVPALALAAVVWWSRRREPGWWPLGLAVAALTVPFAHLHAVDVAVRAILGARAAVTVDGVAVVVAWLSLLVLATWLHTVRRTAPAGTS